MLKKFDELIEFALEHGGTLRNHKQFFEMMHGVRAYIEGTEKELWAINDELVKAGYKPARYETFAELVALLRQAAAQQANGADAKSEV